MSKWKPSAGQAEQPFQPFRHPSREPPTKAECQMPSAKCRVPSAEYCLLLLNACTASNAAKRPVATIDTLPSGVVQVSSAQPTLWADSSRAWDIAEVARFGSAEGPGQLVEPGSIGVDDAGRVYVADRKPMMVKVFDSTGAFVRAIGREGAGPGEFRVAFIAVRGSNLVVHDPMSSRTSVFDTSGAYLRSWKSSCCYWDEIFIDNTERIYVPTAIPRDSAGASPGRAFTRYRMSGEVVDTLFVPTREAETKEWRFVSLGTGKERSMMSTSVPFTPTVVHAFHPEGGVITGWTAEYRIVRSPAGRDTTRIMTRAWTADPIPESLRQAQVDEMIKNAKGMVGEEVARGVVKLSDVPTVAPAFVGLKVDPSGMIWARHLIGSDSTKTRFDVFGTDGAWLGQLTTPIGLPEYGGMTFTRDGLLAAVEGDDGLPTIVRLRFTR